MKLIAAINEEQYDINIIRKEEKVFAEIDGRCYELEVTEPESNIYLLKNEGKIYEVFVSPNSNTNEPKQVKIGTSELEINIIDPKSFRGTIGVSGNTDGIAEIKTAMPGKVVRILLKQDQEVKEGEGVIIVEAMKMQNEMKSPKDGVIKEVNFNEGDTVNAGDILVVIE